MQGPRVGERSCCSAEHRKKGVGGCGQAGTGIKPAVRTVVNLWGPLQL